MLDEQTKDDLKFVYDSIGLDDTAQRELFWMVLKCVGCAEELRLYLAEQEDEE